MKTVAIVAALVAVSLPVALSARQTTEKEQRLRIAALIENRLRTDQPVELAADTVTLTGDVLRLKGHATLRFDDTSIIAAEATINRASNRVELVGDVQAHLGRALAPLVPIPRVEYR